MAIVGYLEILVALLCFLFVRHWRRNMNSPLTNWPLVGMLPQLLCNMHRIHDFVAWLLQKSDGTFEFKGPWFLNFNFLIISDPKNVRYILNKKFSNYHKGTEFKEIFDILGDGIFNSDSDLWKNQRNILHSLMKDKKFEKFVETTVQQKLVHGLIPILEHFSKSGMEVDMQDLFQGFTFDNICSLVLGFDPNYLSIESPKVSFEKAFKDIEEAILYRNILPQNCWKLQRWLQIGEEKKLSRARETLFGFLDQCISLKHMKVSQSKSKSKAGQEEASFNLLAGFMEQGEHVLGSFPEPDIFLRDVAINLLVAGRDTISACLVWFFWLVATNPSVENNILKEMKASSLQTKHDGDEWRFWTAHEVSKLVYLHGALCETLRLYPPVPFEHKVSIEADILPSGHHVKPNTRMIYSLYGMGRMQGIWGEDCLEFKPERWITEKGGIMHVSSYKFIAFNSGPRTCLGKDISFVEMKLVAIAILWNYHVEIVEGHNVYPSSGVILHMKNGLKVTVIKRYA